MPYSHYGTKNSSFKASSKNNDLFNRSLIRSRRERIAASFSDYDFLNREISDRLIDNLHDIKMSFETILSMNLCDDTIRSYFKDILENGIEYNRVRYYIKDDIFNQIFNNSFASKLYKNSVDYTFNITLIEDESEIKAVKEQITSITSFVDFIKTKLNTNF